MKKITFLLFISLLIFIFSKNDYKEPATTDPGYEELLKWGKQNSLNITKKIKIQDNILQKI